MGLRNLENVMPAITLDFYNSKQLDPRVTFTRASFAEGGTPIPPGSGTGGVNGEIMTFNTDVPRLTDQGLLIEESRTNYIQNSIDFNAGDWSFNSNGTSPGIPVCTPNSGTAPDGTNTATRLVCDHGGGTTYTDVCHLRCNRDSSTRQVVSIWVKSNTGSDQTIYMTNGLGGSVIVTNTWKRYLGLSSDYRIGARGDKSQQNVDVLIWGAQVEDGDNVTGFYTSYIPTSGSTTTRAPDICEMPAAGVYNPAENTIINSDFGVAGGSDTLTVVGDGNLAKRTVVYNSHLPQDHINQVAGIHDEFWQWRVLGSSFGLPNASTDGQLTVDWGDGSTETLSSPNQSIPMNHTFTNGGGYHVIKFRLDSGTFFRPFINNNASHATKVVSLGPAPESMKFDAYLSFRGCTNLESFDATVDASVGTALENAWLSCSSLLSFPFINISTATALISAWQGCTSLTSFPHLDTSSCTNGLATWRYCSGLTSFPALDLSSATNLKFTWDGCNSLTSFPLVTISSATSFNGAWLACTSLTTFPANFFDSWTGTPDVNCFANSWAQCPALTATSVENILNSIDASGQSAPASGKDITITYNTSTGVPFGGTLSSGVITPAPAVITSLKSRNWDVKLNGVLQ